MEKTEANQVLVKNDDGTTVAIITGASDDGIAEDSSSTHFLY